MRRDNDTLVPSGLVHKLDASEKQFATPLSPNTPRVSQPLLVWNWDAEHADRKLEAKADAALRDAAPFQVDRKLLKDIVHEKMGSQVARIKFLGAGTYSRSIFLSTLNNRAITFKERSIR